MDRRDGLVNKITRHAPAGSIEPEKKTPNDAAPNLSKTKRLLGEKLFVKVQPLTPQHAGKVTGMLLEAPVNDINCWLDSDTLLREKVREAESCLRNPGKDTWADKVKSTPDLIPHAVKTKGGKGKSPQSNKDPPQK